MTEMRETSINGKWSLMLPAHRAARPEWGQWRDDQDILHEGWEVERLDSMHKNIGPSDVVYDIGTEEGDISALIATWIGHDNGGICLFEPNPRVWANIYAIWEHNDLKPPLAFVQGFAGDENHRLNELDITHWPESATGPVISDHGFANLCERPDLPSIMLEDFVTLLDIAPTVITIDVEGSELRVLHGAEGLLKSQRPLVYCSVHENFMAAMYDDTPQYLYDYMNDLGYRSKILGVDHEVHAVFWHPEGREFHH